MRICEHCGAHLDAGERCDCWENEPTYEQRLIMKNAEERPTYFMCGKKSLSSLLDKARAEADQLLKELQMFYNFGGKVEIEIFPVDHELCYSVGAKLTFDGALVRSEDTCDLLFLALNNIMMNRMLKSEMISFGKGEGEKTCVN